MNASVTRWALEQIDRQAGRSGRCEVVGKEGDVEVALLPSGRAGR